MILFTALLLSAFQLNAFIPDGDEGDPEEIELYNSNNQGNGPTSVNTFTIHAYKTNTTVYVLFSGYTGNANLVASGLGGTIFSGSQWVNGTGCIILNISSLPEGDYTLDIYCSSAYWGCFRK